MTIATDPVLESWPARAPIPEGGLRGILERITAPERVLDRALDRIAFASDASFYRLIPKAVVLAQTVDEVASLFRLARETKIPMTLRAAGTSLSGQAVTDGLLVEVARHWRTVTVEDGGKRFRAQPGVIGASVNAALRPYRVKMGPDPASINTCTMGASSRTTASGMCCGVTQNAYHTLESLTFLLPSGTRIDTAAPDADARFRAAEPALWQGILDLKAKLEGDPALAGRIRSKYRMKNTTGYSLNAFLDFEKPVEIFRNLLVGAEGTLAFISEAVLSTVPDLPVKYTGLLLFPTMHAACAAIVPLRDSGAKALELLDRASLRSVETQPGVPASIRPSPTAPRRSSSSTRRRTSRSGARLEARRGLGRRNVRPPRAGPFHARRDGAGAPLEGAGRVPSPRSARPAGAGRRSSSRTSPSRSSTSPTPPST